MDKTGGWQERIIGLREHLYLTRANVLPGTVWPSSCVNRGESRCEPPAKPDTHISMNTERPSGHYQMPFIVSGTI